MDRLIYLAMTGAPLPKVVKMPFDPPRSVWQFPGGGRPERRETAGDPNYLQV